jgi:hypothetical protein
MLKNGRVHAYTEIRDFDKTNTERRLRGGGLKVFMFMPLIFPIESTTEELANSLLRRSLFHHDGPGWQGKGQISSVREARTTCQ